MVFEMTSIEEKLQEFVDETDFIIRSAIVDGMKRYVEIVADSV